MTTTVNMLLHLALALAMPPLLLGVIARTKAVFAGRRGPPLLQPYHDLVKLVRKGSVFSRTTTWVFRAGPVVGLATAGLATLVVPLGSDRAPVSFDGDLVLFAYLLGLGRFFTVAAALDTGSAFEGMGGAREATFACLAEPALFLGLLVLARASGSLSLSTMLAGERAVHWAVVGAPFLAVLVSFFVVLLAETSRIPFDDPTTHLELTMIHEAMVLDHGGPALAAVLYGASLKLFVLGALVVGLALPQVGAAGLWAWAWFAGGMLLLAVVIGVVESVMARVRLLEVPRLLLGACILSAFGLVLLAR